MAPHWYEIVLGCVSVAAGCLVVSAGFLFARRTRNRWGYLVAGAAALFVAGVAGQRSFPTAEQVHRLGGGASRAIPGPWDAGIGLPGLGVQVTPVALAGLLIGLTALGLSLLLGPGVVPSGEPARRLAQQVEDDDSA